MDGNRGRRSLRRLLGLTLIASALLAVGWLASIGQLLAAHRLDAIVLIPYLPLIAFPLAVVAHRIETKG